MSGDALIRVWLMKYAEQAPLYLVWFAGIVLALLFWRRYPGVSRLMLMAMSLLLLQALAAVLVLSWLQFRMRHVGLTQDELLNYILVLEVLRIVMRAAAWILMLIAVLGWRRQAPAPRAVEPLPGPAGPPGGPGRPTAVPEDAITRQRTGAGP